MGNNLSYTVFLLYKFGEYNERENLWQNYQSYNEFTLSCKQLRKEMKMYVSKHRAGKKLYSHIE